MTLTQDVSVLKYQTQTRLMGLDVGDKTVGVSLSDPTWQIATPLLTLSRRGTAHDTECLCELMREHQIRGVVIGYPLNMNGTVGPQAEKVYKFAQVLADKTDIPIVLWDERWSTRAATRSLLEGDISRKKRGQVVDKVAAAYILQGVLNLVAMPSHGDST